MSAKTLVSILILALGAAMLVGGLRLRAGVRYGLDWPTTTATVLERGVKNGSRIAGYSVIRYRYEVGGKPYESTNVYSASPVGRNIDSVQKWVDALPAQIDVHYNPADPAKAYILPTPGWTYWIVLAGGVVFILVAAARFLASRGGPQS